MMNLPHQTNIPYSIVYEIIIDSLELTSDNVKENIIEVINFHIKAYFNGTEKHGEKIVCYLDSPEEKFKNFSKFTKQEIIDILEQKCFEEILVSKTNLNSQFYVKRNIVSSQGLPWN